MHVSITDTQTYEEVLRKEVFHQHKNIRDMNPQGPALLSKIRVIVVAAEAQEQACDWRSAIFPALPPIGAMSNTFPLLRQLPLGCHRARFPTPGCARESSHQQESV